MKPFREDESEEKHQQQSARQGTLAGVGWEEPYGQDEGAGSVRGSLFFSLAWTTVTDANVQLCY